MAGEIQGVEVEIQDPSKSPLQQWFDSIMKLEEGKQPQGLKIPKVPYMLKNKCNEKYYCPTVVSIGPYHRDIDEVKEMQKLKHSMVRQFVVQSEKSIEEMYSKIRELYIGTQNAEECYDPEAIANLKGEEFTQMMFVDGCFILQFIFSVMENPDDLKMSTQEVAYVKRDLFLLENQLPYEVLKTLLSLRSREGRYEQIITNFINIPEPSGPVSIKQVAKKILQELTATPLVGITILLASVVRRVGLPCLVSSPLSGIELLLLWKKGRKYKKKEDQDHVHLLDHLYAQLIDKDTKPGHVPKNQGPYLYYSAKNLKKVGILFKPSRTSVLTDVEFESTLLSGILKLPPITIDESTQALLLNLVAYESCTYESNKHWATAYICFMDSLINDAEDVKLLRSSGIINSFLGTDEQVADMFNGMANGLVPHPFAYGEVKKKINLQFRSICKKWLAECLEVYFRSPWTVIAVGGALAAIGLTAAAQTYYAAISAK